MTTVSETILKYAAVGAETARRKDQQVARQTQETARQAKRAVPSIKAWMRENRAAIAAVGAGVTGVMAAVIASTPALQGSLAGIRLAFSLLLMQIGNEMAPAFLDLENKILDATGAFIGLDQATDGLASRFAIIGAGAGIAAAGMLALLGPTIGVSGALLTVLGVTLIVVGVFAALQGELGLATTALWGAVAVFGVLAAVSGGVLVPVFFAVLTVAGLVTGIYGVLEGETWAVIAGALALAAGLLGLVKTFGVIVGAAKTVIAFVAAIASKFTFLLSVAKVIGAGIAIIAAKLGISFGAAALLVVGAILLVVGIIWLLWRNWDTVVAAVVGAGEWMARQAQRFWAWFTGAIPSREQVGNAAQGIVDWFRALPSRMWGWGIAAIDSLRNAISSRIPSVTNVLGRIKPPFLNPSAEKWGIETIMQFAGGAEDEADRRIGAGTFGLEGGPPMPRGGFGAAPRGGGDVTVILENGAVQVFTERFDRDTDLDDLADRIGRRMGERLGGRGA